MVDKVGGSVVLAQLHVAFFVSVITRNLILVVGHLLDLHILLHIEVTTSIMAPCPAWINSAGACMSSTPADVPILSALTASFISSYIIE